MIRSHTTGKGHVALDGFTIRLWRVVLVIAAILSSGPAYVEAQSAKDDYCFVREGRESVVGVKITALYEQKLFVTKDDVARYVFLTNANYNGDSSVAVYRAPGKVGSLPGEYWITSTEVSTSLLDCIPDPGGKQPRVDPRKLVVRRADAPLPASTAQIVHELWLTLLERSRVDERAVPASPTAIISASNAQGSRLKAVTGWLGDDAPCLALMQLGLLLTNYPQLPAAERARAAREIERKSERLLAPVKPERRR